MPQHPRPQHPRPQRVHRPKRHGGVEHAHGATFAQLTQHKGTGVQAGSPYTAGPFRGADARALAKKYGQYDTEAQAWIARALAERDIRAKMRVNMGTAPELALAGRYLSKGYVLHKQLFFQEEKLRFFRHFSRVFVADVAILAPGGGLILLPVDGLHFHARTLKQEIDTLAQHNALTRLGRVVPVPDTECLSAVRLDNYLLRHGVP
jgi:hypothetical protein